MKTNGNESIHSTSYVTVNEVDGHVYEQEVNLPGLTKREHFAALAMQGLLSAVYSSTEMLNEFTLDESKFRRHLTGCVAVSSCAVNYADALIQALNEGKEDANG